jgi:hypothetical protein
LFPNIPVKPVKLIFLYQFPAVSVNA